MATIEERDVAQSSPDAVVLHGMAEVGAALQTALVVVGERLGLYRALAGAGPLAPAELARRAEADERYVREWLNAQAAGGYVEYDPDSGRYTLPERMAAAFAGEPGDAYLPGLCQLALGLLADASLVARAASTGGGIPWGERLCDVREGRERFLLAALAEHLVADWLPALDGVVARLERGADVADVRCGRGSAAILMALAYPVSRFHGFDEDERSVGAAVEAARVAGVAGRAHFRTGGASSYSGRGFDLVTMFDCLHDLGDPAGAARHVRSSLSPEGTWLIVEPRAGDRVEENLNPVGRAYYGFSTLLCTPSSLAQEVGLALGAQAGEARIRDVVTAGGFSSFRRVAETPFHMVFEARP
jgi:SAM-dependent methyltransferase